METKKSKLGRPKGSKNRISLTEMDDVESEINEQSKQIVKRFSASIEKLKECINSQLSNIEMEFNDAILDLRKDAMQLKQEINILKQTNDVLEGNVASVHEIINKQTEKKSTILSVTLDKITCESLVSRTPRMSTVLKCQKLY